MSDILTNDTKAIVLLCAVLGKDRSVKPLTPTKYNAIVRWLISENLRPGDLLNSENAIAAAIGTGIEVEYLTALLGRGVQLGFSVEEWHRNGVWIISRSDSDYPARYKAHLKNQSPPLIFGIGDRSLLNSGGIGIVGSRNVDSKGEVFTRKVAELCKHNGMTIVSGGARGVDSIAMNTALNAGGVSVGVLAENLLKKSLEKTSRKYIAEGRLLLISHCHPHARFNVGTAMGRNKLIYALADYGLVVSAEHNKGGTWAGAAEELKREVPVPVFSRIDEGVPLGNKKLLDLGAIPWPNKSSKNNLNQELKSLIDNREEVKTNNLGLFDTQDPDFSKYGESSNITKNNDKYSGSECLSKGIVLNTTDDAIYNAVLPMILHRLESPKELESLAETLKISKIQLKLWVEKSIREGKVRKLMRPVRYEVIN